MHSVRSRNDEVATCMRIRLRDELLSLMEELTSLRAALISRAADNINTLMPGFTHLQHAQPTTLAHHLLAHSDALARDTARVSDAFSRVNKSPLGAAAFASTGFALNRERTCMLLGFGGLMENSMDAVSSRDFLIESAAVMANIMINLSKMAEEIVIWSSTEFSFIELDDMYASTSSIMPQKKNPDTAELMRGKSGVAVGSLMTLLTICKGLPLSYNRDLQEATPNVWRSVETTRSAVRIMAGMIGTMKVNADVMAMQSTTGFTTATELADTMVRAAGIPFRTAHHIVGALARGDGNPSLAEVDEVAKAAIGETLSSRGLTEEMIKEALDPVLNINKRSITGGPSPDEVSRAISAREDDLEEERFAIGELNRMIENALSRLFDVAQECIDSQEN